MHNLYISMFLLTLTTCNFSPGSPSDVESQSHEQDPVVQVIDRDEKNSSKPPISSIGDFNGDKVPDTIDIKENFLDPEYGDQGRVNCYLFFSDKGIPPIIDEDCFRLAAFSEGDLDGDGADELSIFMYNRIRYDPFARVECWSLKHGKWKKLFESDFCRDIYVREAVQKLENGLIRYYTTDDAGSDHSVDGSNCTGKYVTLRIR